MYVPFEGVFRSFFSPTLMSGGLAVVWHFSWQLTTWPYKYRPHAISQTTTAKSLVMAIWCAWMSFSCLPSMTSQIITVPSSKMETSMPTQIRVHHPTQRHLGKMQNLACPRTHTVYLFLQMTHPGQTFLVLTGGQGLIKGTPLHLGARAACHCQLPHFFKQRTSLLQQLTLIFPDQVSLVAFIGSCSSMDRIFFGGSNCQIMMRFGTMPSDWLLNLSLAVFKQQHWKRFLSRKTFNVVFLPPQGGPQSTAMEIASNSYACIR